MTALIFALIKENYVSEQGARMVSMDGASKNAGDMIDKLNLSFNRMRQAVSNRSQIPEIDLDACSKSATSSSDILGNSKNHKILLSIFLKSWLDPFQLWHWFHESQRGSYEGWTRFFVDIALYRYQVLDQC